RGPPARGPSMLAARGNEASIGASENAQVMLEIFRSIERRDAQRFLDLCHSDVEFHWPPSLPYGGASRGRPGTSPTWSDTWLPLQPGETERRMDPRVVAAGIHPDRKSTRLNSSHLGISYAVFCLK